MKTICNILIVLSMLFAFIFSEKICVAQFVGDVKQENKTEQENKAKQKNETDQDNQPKTYTGLELCSLHDLDKGDVYDFGDEITLYKIGELSNKKPTELTTQMKDGFIVRNVDQGSPADTAKLQKDDIIVSFSGRRFATLEKYETWLKNNITPKISLIVYKRSDDYQKNKTVIITPTVEKPENEKIKKTNKNTRDTFFEQIDQAGQKKKQELEKRIKNAKTVPLFEGSNIKKIQNAINVFGKDVIFSSDLPKPYHAKDSIHLDDDKNIVLLENELIVIDQNTLNEINEIITATDSKDREAVLKKLLHAETASFFRGNLKTKRELFEEERLAIRIKNAAVPLFEGSNIKEIQDAIQVFGKEGIPFVLLPKPYETNEIRISPHEYDGKENAILLDENKFIVIEKDILNNIREIITATDSKDQETVLKKFLQELLKSRYDGARTIKKELLTIQLKNAKMEPLFEGSSVKKILNPLNVFGTKTIHYSDLPESYKMENDRVFLTDYDKNTILIDKDNKLIEIKNDALNTITEIIKATDIKDQESVLKKLLQEVVKDSYNTESILEKEHLAIRIKNAAVPLFEGSSIKEIQNVQQVFGQKLLFEGSSIKEIQDVQQELYSFPDLPEPYTANVGYFNGKEDTILLDGHKLFIIEKDILNEIITGTDAKDRESILKRLLLYSGNYDREKAINEALLFVRLKNAKTETLFEGSSIKKILDAQNIFGTKDIYDSDDIRGSSYTSDGIIRVKNDNGTENTIVLDGNKLITIDTMTMDCINEIIPAIKNQEDREIVLKGLINGHFIKDKIEKNMRYSGGNRELAITIIINVDQKTIMGALSLGTLTAEWLFADTIRVVDANGFDWTSGKLKFDREIVENGAYCYEKIFLPLTNKSIKNVVNSIIQGKGCTIRFYGEKGYLDKNVNAQYSERTKVIYDAYNVLTKTFKESASQQQTSDSAKTKPKSIILISGSSIIVLFIIGIITVAVIWGVKVSSKNQRIISTEKIPPNDTIEFKL